MQRIEKYLNTVSVKRFPEAVVDAFIHDLMSELSPATLIQYKSCLLRFCTRFREVRPGADQISDVFDVGTFVETQRLFNRDLNRRQNQKNPIKTSLHMINQYRTAWKRFYQWGENQQLCSSGETSRYGGWLRSLNIPKRVRGIVDYRHFLLEEIDYSSRSLRYWRNICIIELMLFAGLRPMEVCRLNIDSVDLETHKIRITGKSDSRTVWMDRIMASHLMYYLFYHTHKDCSDLPLFISLSGAYNGHRLSYDALRRVVTEKTADLYHTPIRPFMLRHTWAAHMLTATNAPLEVSKLLGLQNLAGAVNYLQEFGFIWLERQYQACHPRARRKYTSSEQRPTVPEVPEWLFIGRNKNLWKRKRNK